MTFKIGPAFHSGTVSSLKLGSLEWVSSSVPILIKTANNSGDSDLLLQEYTSLTALQNKLNATTYKQCIPIAYESDLVGSFRTNLLQLFPGFVSAKDVRKMVGSVDARTIVWIWKRLLGLLTWVDGSNHIHGAILPPHLLLYPDNTRRAPKDPNIHAIRLIDWAYSQPTFCLSLKAWCPEYADFYPPEVLDRDNIGPWTDIYMGAKTMLFLLGGDVLSNTFPAGFPDSFKKHFRYCLQDDWRDRNSSSLTLFEEFKLLAHDEFGPAAFHEFILPGI